MFNAWRMNRLLSISAALVFLTVTFAVVSYKRPETFAFASKHFASSVTRDPVLDVFFETHKPRPVDSQQYRPFDSRSWDLKDPARWDRPLGQDLCIIDLDSRPYNLAGQLFAEPPMAWNSQNLVHGLSVGLLNHWLYAKIHDYKYYYVQVDDYKDRRSSWKKAPVMSRLLNRHRVCLFLDSDATFPRLDLPFEWLLNYWQFNPGEQSLALAYDPVSPKNTDSHGNIFLNTGFIIAQNLSRTQDILAAWEDCPNDGGRHPDCSRFRTNAPGFPTDQGGFGEFIRYEFNKPTDILSLPCAEANGCPETHSGCDGELVSHFWGGKETWIKDQVGGQLPGPYLPLMHAEFLREKPTFYMTEEELMAQGS